MGKCMRYVEEERRRLRIHNKLYSLPGVAFGEGIEVGRLFNHCGVVKENARFHVVAIRYAEVLIESAVRRQIWLRAPEMPFPDRHGFILALLQHGGHGGLIEIQPAGSCGKQNAGNADTRRVPAGQKGGAGWRADWIGGAEIRKPHAFRGHTIQVGRFYTAAIGTEIAVAKVVAEDEYDVRRF